MARISGNTSENSRIMIIDESDWSVESNNTYTSGNFNISNLTIGKKTIISRSNDGECLGYGNIDSLASVDTPFLQDFSSSIDPEYWSTGGNGDKSIVSGKLRLEVGDAGMRVTQEAWINFNKYTVSGDFQFDIDFNIVHSDNRSVGSGWNTWNYQFRATIDSTHWLGSKVHWTWRGDHGGDYWGFKVGSMAFYQNGGSTVETPYPSYLTPEAFPTGTYRIERIGNLWTLKYKIDSTWYTAVSNISIGSGPVSEIIIYANEYNHDTNWPKLVVDFDNFKINYGIID